MIKNYLKKGISVVIITTSIIVFNSVGASAEWKKDNHGWWYTEGSAWATGWRLIEGNWYYFYSDGYMAENTTIDGYYLSSSGSWTNSISSNAQILTLQKSLIGKWKGGYMGNDYCLCTESTIDGEPYQVVFEESNFDESNTENNKLVIKIRNDPNYKVLIRFTDKNTIRLWSYNPANKSYTGGGPEFKRIN